jgi:NAD(P)H-hydrate epimerase
MSAGGTGDVLAGLAGSLIAQGMNIFEAGCCSAFINGAAGDELLELKGNSFTAMDLASELPYTIQRIMSGGV